MPTRGEKPSETQTIDSLFTGWSQFWDDVYEGNDVYAVVHQRRQRIALAWVDGLDRAPTSRALDVGCGAGRVAVALSARGFEVDAVDAVDAMVDLTRKTVDEAGIGDRVRIAQMGVEQLDFEDGSFDLVLALGLIPWVPDPRRAVAELARVTRPGGHVIVNIDNSIRAAYLLDPRTNPWIAPLRNGVKASLAAAGLREDRRPLVRTQSRSWFDRLLASAALQPRKATTFGYGPFTFMGRALFSDGRGVRIDRRLQELADRGVPGLRAVGAQYMVLAQKRR